MLDKLRTFIFEELVFIDSPDSFKSDDDLLEAGLDSMGIMRLVLFIEEEFGVVLPDDELEPSNLQTLAALTQWIEKHQN